MTDTTQQPPVGTQPPAGQAAGQDFEKMYRELNEQITSGQLIAGEIKKRVDSGELFLKDRFAGLQTSLNAAVNEKKTLSESLSANQATVEAMAKQKQDLEDALKANNDKIAAMGLSLTTAEKKAARASLILKDFPQLAPFEADGLLPDADIETLPAVLGTFAEKLGTLSAGNAQARANGGMATPPASSGNTKRTSKELMALVQDASLGNTANGTYDQLYSEYLAVAAQENKQAK